MRIPAITRLLQQAKRTGNTKKVFVHFAIRTAGDDYDPEENNYTYTNLNPICIENAIVTPITPEELVWKQYGLEEMGAVEIITDKAHKNKFKICNKIVIEDNEYLVFKEGTGGNVLIQDRPGNLIRVILRRK